MILLQCAKWLYSNYSNYSNYLVADAQVPIPVYHHP